MIESFVRFMDQLQIENIHAGYGKKEVLRGLSLSVAPGEIVAMIGPNGAGKSTLLRVIAGFLRPTSGKIRFEGKDINSLAPHERIQSGLAYFMQGGKVFAGLSVLENLEIAANGNPSHTKEKRITDVLEIFSNLKSLLRRRAGLLSGGERQGLALGMTLVQRPNVILLDEPSAGLSPVLVQQVLGRIKELNKTWKLSILLVEQNAREALNLADRAVILVDGQLAEETSNPRSWIESDVLHNHFLGETQKIGVSKP